MELLLRTRDLWASPAQFAVMTMLCWRDHDKRGFAVPSKREIASVVGVTPRRVLQVYGELEAMQALTRLGPDSEFGGRNRYVVTIEKAIDGKKAGSPFDRGEAGFLGGSSPLPGGEEARFPGGGKPASPPSGAKILRDVQKEQNAATATPRLPLFPLATRPEHPEHRAIAAAKEHRLQKLRRRIAGLARSILLNPTAGAALLNGEDIGTNISALVEATKRLAARKRVQGYIDVVHPMCISELFKFTHRDVLSGVAPRPRDRARRGRQGGQR